MSTRFLSIVFGMSILLSCIQFITTPRSTLTHLSEIEKIAQTRRMNEYPRPLARLANIIEARSEAVVYFHLEHNFVAIFDLNYYFSEIRILLLPVFCLGVFRFISKHSLDFFLITLPPIIAITIAGTNNKYGLFSIQALIIFYTVFAANTIYKEVIYGQKNF